MFKKMLYVGVSTILLLTATAAKSDTFAISAEMVCKTGKSGTDIVVLSGKGASVNISNNTYYTQPLSYILSQLNPPIDTSGENLQNQDIPCSLATAAVDAAALKNLCINSLALSLGIAIPANTLNLGFEIKFAMSPSTTVVLGNGNIVHQWNGICSTDTSLVFGN